MRNGTATKKAKDTKKSKTAKGSAAKPAAKKTAAGNKPAKTGSAEKPAAGKVFRIDQNGGTILVVNRKEAVEDVLAKGAFTEDVIAQLLDNGDLVFSEAFYYSTNRDKLAQYEKAPQSEDPNDTLENFVGKPAAISDGDTVIHEDGKRFGTVVNKDGKLRVEFEIGGHLKSQLLSNKWNRPTDEQLAERQLALEKASETISGEIVPEDDTPLTDEERTRLEELKATVLNAKNALDSAPFALGSALDEIRVKKLYRESKNEDGTHMTFGEYVTAEFGITREYAQNLAQLSGFHSIAVEQLTNGTQLSVNATNRLMRDMNSMAKDLGIGKGFDILKPIIKETTRLLVEVAPKDEKTGDPQINPRFIQTFTDTVRDAVNTSTIEVDGKQYTIEEAKKKGFLGIAIKDQVVTAAAENILARSDTIRRDVEETWNRINTPVTTATNPSQSKVFYSGEPFGLGVSCDKHGATKIISIGNGVFQTKCKCRWRIDADSNALVVFEVNGKKVKR